MNYEPLSIKLKLQEVSLILNSYAFDLALEFELTL